MREAAEMAIDKINATGGILGKKVKLQIEDDADQPKQAVAAANRLVSSGVGYVVGHWDSGMTFPASDIYAENNVLMITPESILSEITTKGRKLVFHTIGTDKQLAEKISEYLQKTYSPKDKIFILTDASAPEAQATSKYVESGLSEADRNNITKEYYFTGTKHFSALTTEIKQINPAVIYCSCFDVEAGLIMRTVRNAGVTAPFVGWDVFNSHQLWEIAGPAAEGTVFVSDQDFIRSPSAREFGAELEARKVEPEATHFYTYASFWVIQKAA